MVNNKKPDDSIREYETAESYVLRMADEYPVLKPLRELELMKRFKSLPPDEHARLLLIKHNQKLVVRIVRLYLHKAKTLDLEDLMQEGNIGLSRALDKFDISRGYKFSTVAWWWIREAVDRAIKNQDKMVRIPVHTQNEAVQVARAWGGGITEEHTVLSTSELSERTGLSKERVLKHKLYAMDHLSLDTPLQDVVHCEYDFATIIDTIADVEKSSPDEYSEYEEDRNHVHEWLGQLEKSEREFLRLKYGLRDGYERTRAEMAELYKTTVSRVGQMERKILAKFKSIARQSDLNSAKQYEGVVKRRRRNANRTDSKGIELQAEGDTGQDV